MFFFKMRRSKVTDYAALRKLIHFIQKHKIFIPLQEREVEGLNTSVGGSGFHSDMAS